MILKNQENQRANGQRSWPFLIGGYHVDRYAGYCTNFTFQSGAKCVSQRMSRFLIPSSVADISMGGRDTLIAQTMNGWTDRPTEELVRCHAGVRLLCGLEGTTTTMDRTRIEAFRNCVGKTSAEELNQMVLRSAIGAGFTGIEICAADTTVQESPIAYPTEVGHMKNIAEKILGFGKTLGLKSVTGLGKLKNKAQGLFTSIRLFTRGKTEQALEKKKKLSKKLNSRVQKMVQLAKADLEFKRGKLAEQAREQLELFGQMLDHHSPDGRLCDWNPLPKNRRRRGYSNSRRSDHQLHGYHWRGARKFRLRQGCGLNKNKNFLGEVGVENICIFPKGRRKIDVPSEVLEMARRERSLNEASIAKLKSKKYNFTKSRARSQHACDHKVFSAMVGFNLNPLFRYLGAAMEVRAEIT